MLWKKIPFKSVYIHGLVRNKDGQKFSKSLQNTIDPLLVIEKYGADALRLALLGGVTPGNDTVFEMEKVKYEKHFCNKLWNISRFVLQERDLLGGEKVKYTETDNKIIERAKSVRHIIAQHLQYDQFHLALEELHEYVWHEFADQILEDSKLVFKNGGTEAEARRLALINTLSIILKTSHPFMPFITEEIWQSFNKEKSLLLVERWEE